MDNSHVEHAVSFPSRPMEISTLTDRTGAADRQGRERRPVRPTRISRPGNSPFSSADWRRRHRIHQAVSIGSSPPVVNKNFRAPEAASFTGSVSAPAREPAWCRGGCVNRWPTRKELFDNRQGKALRSWPCGLRGNHQVAGLRYGGDGLSWTV